MPDHKDDVLALLTVRHPEAIVDIRISSTVTDESALAGLGYEAVLPNGAKSEAPGVHNGSFGRGQSLWIWRRKQGTCCGRLRPILSLKLTDKPLSSALVFEGFTRLNVPIGSSHYLWIKRSLSDAEDALGITNIAITTGNAKIGTDKTHIAPGIGWTKVEGNFGKGGMFSSSKPDCFVWVNTSNSTVAEISVPVVASAALTVAASSSSPSTSSPSSLPVNPALTTPVKPMTTIGGGVPNSSDRTSTMSGTVASDWSGGRIDSIGYGRFLKIIRTACRHYVTLEALSLAKQFLSAEDDVLDGMTKVAFDRKFDFVSHFHIFDTYKKNKLKKPQFRSLLLEVGLAMESADMSRCFYLFNTNMGRSVTIGEFVAMLTKSDYEIDLGKRVCFLYKNDNNNNNNIPLFDHFLFTMQLILYAHLHSIHLHQNSF